MQDELELALKIMKNGKAPGVDCNSNMNEHIKAVCSFYNNCLVTRKFPSTWKLSDLRNLFKGKGSISNVNSYRGLSLSYSLYNLLDRIMDTMMHSKNNRRNFLQQIGFVKGRCLKVSFLCQ
jgi:hypothetical protein